MTATGADEDDGDSSSSSSSSNGGNSRAADSGGQGKTAASSAPPSAVSYASAAAVVMPIDFIRLPAIAVVGMLAYGEPLEIWVLIGAAVIFAGNYINILSETRNAVRMRATD